MNFFNQYSYVLVTLFIFLTCLGLLRLLNVAPRMIGLVAVVLAGVFSAGLFILRPGASDVTTLENAETLLQNGKSTFLEFFSNY